MRCLGWVLVVIAMVGCGDGLEPAGPDTVIDQAPPPLSSSAQVTVAFHAEAHAEAQADAQLVDDVTFACVLDGGAPVACTSPWSVAVAGDGPHVIAITATGADRATGAPAIADFAIDTVAPDTVITVGPSAVETSPAATFTFAASPAEAGAAFACALDADPFAPCLSPFTVSAADGDHTFQVRAIDAAGNADPTPAQLAWTIDTVGPPLELTRVPSNPSDVATPSFAFDSSDPAATFECALDAGAFAACTSPFTATALADGPHTFHVRAIDTSHDTTTAVYAWTVDTAGPTVTITSGPSGLTSIAAPTFEFTVTTDAVAVDCAIDGAAPAPCASPFTTSTLAEGAHVLAVRATDAAGNAAAATRSFAVDTIGPTVTIVSGPSGPTHVATPSWTFTTTGAPTVIECAVDGGTPAACADTFTVAGLPDGAHTFVVRVADDAGNQGTDSRAIDLDTDPPVVTITSGPTGTTLDATPTFTFAITGTFTVSRCRIDIAAFVPCTDTFTPSPLGGGAHVFEFEADDAAGNTGDATQAFDVDSNAPTISITSGPSGPTDDPAPSFAFTAGATAATIECRVDGGVFAACTSPFAVAPALPEGSHTFEVQACTAVPFCASDTHAFTVDLTAPDLTIASGPQDPTPTGSAQPTFAFTATGATTVTCRITDAADPNPAVVACAATFTPSGALADGAHTFEVTATDDAGNATTRTRAFTVDTGAPTIAIDAPLIPDRVANRQPSVFFTATDTSGVTTTCSVDSDLAAPCDGAAGFASAAALPDGPHTYHVIATDDAGNPSTADVVFVVDLAPPTVTITGHPTDPTNDASPVFTFTTSADTTRARCTLDTGEVVDPCTSGVAFTGVAPGARTFTVTTFDDATPANSADATFTFFLGVCGDGVRQGTEQCDGVDHPTDCAGIGAFTGGPMGCLSNCTFDTALCTTCGNGVVEIGEQCEAGQLGGATCASFGFDTGTLACSSSCSYDTSGCSP